MRKVCHSVEIINLTLSELHDAMGLLKYYMPTELHDGVCAVSAVQSTAYALCTYIMETLYIQHLVGTIDFSAPNCVPCRVCAYWVSETKSTLFRKSLLILINFYILVRHRCIWKVDCFWFVSLIALLYLFVCVSVVVP